jgi:hypothetical protein
LFIDHPLEFSFVLSGHLPDFIKGGSSAVEATSSLAGLRSSDQPKVPASLSLFLKNEKISALLSLGKRREYRPFHIYAWEQDEDHDSSFT